IDIESIKLGILETNLIKGRMERIEKNIYIDYAHTPCATENVLLALKKLRPTGRLIALFGCGGDRDKGKRPIIGKICSEIADLCVITNDNPRCENPNEIIRDILKGIAPERNYIVVPKREEAIFFAVSQMKPDDILVLLGKGHENYEIDKGGKHYFDERVVVKRALFGDKREDI
ncbi:MAG: UDP-N-acetylmuramoyl-L-alanyl-D-glutamate--2,6-diaminopimelate ligase, partial [Clostridia bacterium]|nr:UDP-N-acetylmuramoyl-L-alanyl-D-glutamate--2,6-diaminopimelate ligase [Clostridia bacterium]